MKILILGDDINLFVAADAATFHQRHAVALATPVAEAEPGWALEAPHATSVLSSLIPTANLHQSFQFETAVVGTKEGWDAKVEDPAHVSESFLAGTETVIRGVDYFVKRLEVYGNNLIGLKPSMFPGAVDSADLIINTAARFKVCRDENHTIMSLPFWWSDTMRTGVPENSRQLNGDKAPAWYSSVKVGDHTMVKWRRKPPFDGVFEGGYPAKSNCDCQLGGMVHVGPNATWNAIQTPLDTFSDTIRAIMAKEGN